MSEWILISTSHEGVVSRSTKRAVGIYLGRGEFYSGVKRGARVWVEHTTYRKMVGPQSVQCDDHYAVAVWEEDHTKAGPWLSLYDGMDDNNGEPLFILESQLEYLKS